jgi:hypothetical protein
MPCSASGAHDFHATVIDTHMTSYEKGICECFEKKDAEFIARELNILESIKNLHRDMISKRVDEVTDGK